MSKTVIKNFFIYGLDDEPAQDSANYCARHKREKVWMIQNSFCPECDKENVLIDKEVEPIDYEVTTPYGQISLKNPKK